MAAPERATWQVGRALLMLALTSQQAGGAYGLVGPIGQSDAVTYKWDLRIRSKQK